MTSALGTEDIIKRNQSDAKESKPSNQDAFTSLTIPAAKYHVTSASIDFTALTTCSTNIQYNDNSHQPNEDEHLLGLHYERNRLKQAKLLVFTNIFRLTTILVLAFMTYFLV